MVLGHDDDGIVDVDVKVVGNADELVARGTHVLAVLALDLVGRGALGDGAHGDYVAVDVGIQRVVADVADADLDLGEVRASRMNLMPFSASGPWRGRRARASAVSTALFPDPFSPTRVDAGPELNLEVVVAHSWSAYPEDVPLPWARSPGSVSLCFFPIVSRRKAERARDLGLAPT